ncbi:MAG: TylF/MycF/NovP-related O-methyltransferase [Candidatus Giovannonibacteria bacterium]|nr:TylF/MycF/NovP-related O-methyltransferase [Candidatus Giovannonibacteria bacterium]
MASQKILNLYDEFLAKTSTDRLQKILARYELLKMVSGVPGDIVECGVFKGSGIYTLAKLNNLLMPHAGRKIIGFDFFESKREKKLKKRQDTQVLEWHGEKWEGRETILKNLSALGIHSVELVAGNVIKTTAAYAKKNLGFRIAMLYLDVDNYEGTLAILRNFFPLVTPGGIVVFDEYAIRGHGESDAVNEYFKGRSPKLRSLPWTNTPTAYLIKEKF